MANSVNNIFKMSMTVRNLLGSSRYTTVRLLGTSYAKFTTEGILNMYFIMSVNVPDN